MDLEKLTDSTLEFLRRYANLGAVHEVEEDKIDDTLILEKIVELDNWQKMSGTLRFSDDVRFAGTRKSDLVGEGFSRIQHKATTLKTI